MDSEERVFKWTDAHTADLIVWRVGNNSLFTGRRNAAIKAYELYVKEKQLQGKVTPAWIRKKWENLKQKYKEREGMRERQALEREERREREMFVREERWEKEMVAREERQERDYREREERREREAAAREERLFKLLETFLANK